MFPPLGVNPTAVGNRGERRWEIKQRQEPRFKQREPESPDRYNAALRLEIEAVSYAAKYAFVFEGLEEFL